jgi:tetratricopeptide (TPR) repeat protein
MSKRLFPAFGVLLLAATVVLAGCALRPAGEAVGGIQLEHYLAAQDYRGANAWLEHQARSGADIEAEQHLLQQHIQSFEEANLSRVIEMEKKGDWIEALTTLNAALEKLPSSEVLLEKRAYTIAHRDPALQRSLEKELLIQAAYLRDSLKVLDERQRIRRPTFSDTIHRARLRHEQGQLTDSLLICAKNAIKRGDYTQADRCLQAAKVQGDPKQLAALSQELAAARPKTKTRAKPKPAPDPEQEALRKQQEAIQEAIQRERRKLHAALDSGDLVTASNIILKLTQLEGETPELTTLNGSIEAAIAARVTELLESASTYYGNGDIAEARLQWLEILRLDPGNEQAEANIERADRVLNKLEELQQESTTEPAASNSN